MARYIFITGGVVSSLGKGLASAALGALLQARDIAIRRGRMIGVVCMVIDGSSRTNASDEIPHGCRGGGDENHG